MVIFLMVFQVVLERLWLYVIFIFLLLVVGVEVGLIFEGLKNLISFMVILKIFVLMIWILVLEVILVDVFFVVGIVLRVVLSFCLIVIYFLVVRLLCWNRRIMGVVWRREVYVWSSWVFWVLLGWVVGGFVGGIQLLGRFRFLDIVVYCLVVEVIVGVDGCRRVVDGLEGLIVVVRLWVDVVYCNFGGMVFVFFGQFGVYFFFMVQYINLV